jgi:hypothetical protein
MSAAKVGRCRPELLWSFALAAVFAAGTTSSAAAQCCYCTPDQCDECDLSNCHLDCCHDPPELWVVNTRCAPKCSNLDEGFINCVTFKRFDPACGCCGQFVDETLESFLAQEGNMPTLIFAHGNTLKHEGAMEQCWEIYKRMRCCPGQKRLVFWSWPAEVYYKKPIFMPRKLIDKNLKIKFVFAEYQGYYMAKLLERMSFTHRVTVGGHSYGAISAAVAAHYMGGGSLRGLSLASGAPVQRDNLRLAIVSGAFDNNAMDPGCRYGQSFVAAEKVYNTRNCRDSTLKGWPKISMCGRPAIGVTGINANKLGEYTNKLCQHSLTGDVGKSHYIEPHLESGRFMNALCCIAFPACLDCVNGGATPGSTAPSMGTPSEGNRGLNIQPPALRELVPMPGGRWQRPRGVLN